MSLIERIPTAIHIGADDLPFVDLRRGLRLKVIQVKIHEGLRVEEIICDAGYESSTHKHTGPVYGFTMSGAWKYKEYDYVNRAGSYLYETAGSVHTLQCLEDNTHAFFVVFGANLSLDNQGNVTKVSDAASILERYYAYFDAQELARPSVLVD